MKKNLLFIGLLLAMSLTASAQNKGFSFGLKFGPTFDWTGSKTGAAVNQGTKTGFDLGLAAEYYFAENYAIVTGVNVDFVKGHYSFDDMRNISATDSITDYQLGTVDRQFKTTIYEIPLMLKMVTPELGNLPLRAYAQVGGAFGYTHRVKVMDTFTLGDLNDSNYRATDGEYNPFHASLRIGAGAEYKLVESMRVFAGIYFSHDFLNSISRGALVTNNYEKYYAGNKDLGERDLKLNVLQNRIGIEMGIFF
ncbi:MAG: PorT family protein [Bacteroidales bacterium]|nr:PorT family protein [Bacteroidales bacterium]